eukprot:554047-Pelagomonas_calceolata.AAC.3
MSTDAWQHGTCRDYPPPIFPLAVAPPHAQGIPLREAATQNEQNLHPQRAHVCQLPPALLQHVSIIIKPVGVASKAWVPITRRWPQHGRRGGRPWSIAMAAAGPLLSPWPKAATAVPCCAC